MHSPLRIAVLEADTPIPPINDRYGGYGGVFTSLLTSSAKALNKPDQLDSEKGLVISKWDVVSGTEYPKLEDIDAVLISGSSTCPHSANNPGNTCYAMQCTETK